MASRQVDLGNSESRRVDHVQVHSAYSETKASLMTTEFWAMAVIIAAILLAARQLDHFSGQEAWTLVAAVAIGYMVSRGLAKSGSAYRDQD